MPNEALELMRFHVDALYTHDANGRMLSSNEPNGARAPRFFLGTTPDGCLWRFRDDLEPEAIHALESLAEREVATTAPLDARPYESILARFAPIRSTWTGPAFAFPPELPDPSGAVVQITEENSLLLRPHLEPWLPDVTTGQPLFAYIVGGRAVSVCCSVRKTPAANEAGVETVPDVRGRGYAPQVVIGWARAVRESGRFPLYSTSWKNTASQGVAAKLGLERFGSDLNIA
jgi:hypothetical protein